MIFRPAMVSAMDIMQAETVSNDSERALKLAFAAALLKHPSDYQGRYAAALEVTPDTVKALIIANQWPNDPIVVAEQNSLSNPEINEDAALDAVGLDKLDFYRTLSQFMRGQTFLTMEQLKAGSMIMEMRGWKKGTGLNVNVNNVQNNVMVIKDYGSNEDWETAAYRQQRALIDGARSSSN